MKYILLLLVITLQGIGTVYAEDSTPQIFFETKIFKLLNEGKEAGTLTSDNGSKVLEGSPALIAKAGVKASIEIGIGGEGDNDNEKIVMHLIPDADASKYDVQVELVGGDNTIISYIEDSAVGKPLNFSAKLNDVTRLFTVNARQLSPGEMNMSGAAVAAVDYPEDSCGRVSTFRNPPKNERYFKTLIFNVDGNNVDTVKTTHRVAPGKRIISMDAITPSDRHRRGKGLEFIVEPNKTYHIAAKFIEEKRYSKEDYWEPVIWKVTEEECSF